MKKTKQNISSTGYGYAMVKNSASIQQPQREPESYLKTTAGGDDLWRFGSNNLFPQEIAFLNRSASTHGGIIERKSEYCSGKGFNYDSLKDVFLKSFFEKPNIKNQSLSEISKIFFRSFFSIGNIYINIVTNKKRNFLNLYIKDYTQCRIGKGTDTGFCLIYPDWRNYNYNSKAVKVTIYPEFTEIDGNQHSIMIIRNKMEDFPIYGLPSFISALDPAETLKGANTHNKGRVKDGFSKDGILMAEFNSQAEADEIEKSLKRKLGDENAGGLMLFKKGAGTNAADYVPMSRSAEGEFLTLRTASIEDLVTAHGWPRGLCFLPDNTGFETKKILNEYDIARATVIEPMQNLFNTSLERIFSEVFNKDIRNQISFKNQPPIVDNTYMKLWEYRKYSGLSFDETDPVQNQYIFELNKTKYNASN